MSFWGHSVYFSFSTTLYLENDLLYSKTDTNVGLMGAYFSVYGVFWLLSVQGQSEVIRYISDISDFQQAGILKTAGRRAKRTKIWTSDLLTCM